MKRALGVLAACLISFGACAEDRPTFESLWQKANSAPDHRTLDGGNAIVVDVPSEQAIYYFTKPGQPMHPGVVKRTIVKTKEGISLRTEGWSFGPDSAQPAFKQWLEAFRVQSAEIQAGIRKQQ